jgi:hypothetical protein
VSSPNTNHIHLLATTTDATHLSPFPPSLSPCALQAAARAQSQVSIDRLTTELQAVTAQHDSLSSELAALHAIQTADADRRKALDAEVDKKLATFACMAQTLTRQLEEAGLELADTKAELVKAIGLGVSHTGDMHVCMCWALADVLTDSLKQASSPFPPLTHALCRTHLRTPLRNATQG